MSDVTNSANSQPFGDWDAEENRMNNGKEKLWKYWVSDFFVKFQMRLYRVTFHLDLELEHTLDVDSWGPSCASLVAISAHLSDRRSDLRKKFTDGGTDGRRTPRHCISS